MSTPLLTLNAELELVNEAGKKRVVSLKDFITGPSKTLLKNDEILRTIIVSKWKNKKIKTDYERYSTRNQMDIALASVSVLLEFDEGKKAIKNANIALGGVSPTPIRLPEKLERKLENITLTEDNIAKISEEAAMICNPSGRRTPADYRRQVISILIKRILTDMRNI